jgi:3'-phosphoadenosine 5'-phosphosulfate sulfotransferase (PAPS reductase)/FAD synthetase
LDLQSIAEYSALSDIPVCALYKELDEYYPNSKFIFTSRSTESWVNSAILDTQSSINKYGCMHATTRWAYGLDYIDRDKFIERYEQHQKAVSKYFKNRSDILVMGVNEQKPWQKLCNFLDLSVPNIPFPYLNKRK